MRLIRLIATMAAALSAATSQAEPLTVNWYHDARYLQPVITEFSKQSGVEVRVTSAYDTFDTDVILVSDYKSLTEGKKLGHFQRIQAPDLDAIVPPRWRDRDGYWYGVTLRTRAVIYNKAQVEPGEIQTLQDLKNEKWRGRIALRSAANVYNRSLLASMIVHEGPETAAAWARAVHENAGKTPKYAGDTGNIWRVASGEFALSLINTYYLGYVVARGEEAKRGIKLQDTVGIAWLDQRGAGQPVNVTGVAVRASTKKQEEALKLVRFLLSARGQALLTENVFKYPVRSDVEPSAWLKTHGAVTLDSLNLNDLELHYDQADGIFRSVGWLSWDE